MRRRDFIGAAAGLFAAGALPACGSREADPGGSGDTLRLVAVEHGSDSATGSTESFWNELVRGFRRDHPDLMIDVTVFPPDEADARVAEMVAAGNPPDIAQLGAYAEYAHADLLHPAGDLLTLPMQSDFLPGLARAGEVRHVQYGLPYVTDTRRLLCNRDLFENAGLDPDEPPATREELREAAEALAASGVPIPYGLPLGPEEGHAEAAIWMLGGGGGLTRSGGGYAIDSEENIGTFTWLRDELVRTGLTGSGDPGTTDRREIYRGFGRGEVAMMHAHPTFLRQAQLFDIAYTTGPVPGVDGPSEVTLGAVDWLMAFNGNDRLDSIRTFLGHVFATEHVVAFADRYHLLPVTVPAIERMQVSDEHTRFRPFLEQLPVARPFPVGKVSWARVSGEMRRTIGEAVRPDNDPARVLAALQQYAEQQEAGG
ncbi:extracellular solute-binding protein [Streptomyces calidiresistens]|uniref:extracellular solute-binding protein n=1 Tax=Streptomyces calidiresistens TaxID=1485586 RepID=UPI0015FA5E5A|nr:extracellular solute-binding protein [Streptomyces calidiresistens]